MIRHISATEAVRNFADLISRVFYGGDTFVIEKSGREMCRLVPAKPLAPPTGRDLARAVASWPRADASWADDLDAISRGQQETTSSSPWGMSEGPAARHLRPRGF